MNQEIFKQIQTLKRQILPNDVVILFGSQARGDEREDSDWDLVVILEKPKDDTLEDFGNYAYPFTAMGWNYNVDINQTLYTREQWEQGKGFPFYKNVMREGIKIE